jgi:hypothetical protein
MSPLGTQQASTKPNQASAYPGMAIRHFYTYSTAFIPLYYVTNILLCLTSLFFRNKKKHFKHNDCVLILALGVDAATYQSSFSLEGGWLALMLVSF